MCAHALPALLGLIPGLLPDLTPRSPITMEILPERKASLPRAEAPAAPAPEPKEEARAATGPGPGARAAQKKPRRSVTPPATPPVTPLAGHLGELQTEDATVLLLVRMEPLRGSPHRPAVEALLSAFPDARLLVQGTPLAAEGALARALIDQLQAVVITTTDPRDLLATTLIALAPPRGDGAAGLLAALARRAPPAWEDRRLRTLAPGLHAYGREEVLAQLQATAESEAGLRGLRELPRKNPQAVVSAELTNLHRLVRLSGGLPTPTAVRLSLSAASDPGLTLVIEMADLKDAAAAYAALPALRDRFTEQIRWLGLGGLLAPLKLTLKGSTVTLAGYLPNKETSLLLAYVRLLLSRVPVPQEPAPDLAPQVPPAAPPPPSRAGPPAGSSAPAPPDLGAAEGEADLR